jgi:hypothetical protein
MRHDSLFTIAPDTPFLETLAARVLDGTLLGGWDRSGPFWLSDVTIILPTRRALAARRSCPTSAPSAAKWPTKSLSCPPMMLPNR